MNEWTNGWRVFTEKRVCETSSGSDQLIKKSLLARLEIDARTAQLV